MSKRLLPLFPSRIFMVSGLTLRPLIHFKCIFVYGKIKWSSFILLHTAVQFFQQRLLKRLSFSHWIFFPTLSKMNWSYSCGCISGFSILFYWSMCLFLHLYHILAKKEYPMGKGKSFQQTLLEKLDSSVQKNETWT